MTIPTHINADFSERVTVHASDIEWQPSPMPGVDRHLLDRIGGEVARATSIVRYAPGSQFSSHVHSGGEEFIVLDGVFQDEHGDFPVGAYIRNPPESSHTPGSELGCTIFVKLWQFDLKDRKQVRIDSNKAPSQTDAQGTTVVLLHEDTRESVRIENWRASTEIEIPTSGGAEILVLEGGFEENGETFGKHAWLRTPIGTSLSVKALKNGAKVWIKTGHLRHITLPDNTEPTDQKRS